MQKIRAEYLRNGLMDLLSPTPGNQVPAQRRLDHDSPLSDLRQERDRHLVQPQILPRTVIR
jgi:hypothetical protein